MTTRRVGITELANEFAINRNVARRYLEEAGVKRAADKSYPYRAAAAAIRARKDVAMIVGNRTAGRAGERLTPIDVEPTAALSDWEILGMEPPTDEAATAPAPVDELRTRRVEAQSALDAERMRKLKLANDASEGRLIDREAAERTLGFIVAKTRQAILSAGHSIAPLVVGEEDPTVVARTINDELRRILADFADDRTLIEGVIE
jgi:hypothetical protein